MASVGVDVAELLEVSLPLGGRALVASDLHLGATRTPSGVAAAEELTVALGSLTGPAVVVLAGDCFDLLGGPTSRPRDVLRAYEQLRAALAEFTAAADHTLVCLAGSFDARLAWDPEAAADLTDGLGARLALAVDLVIDGHDGPRRVRVEHGHQVDPAHRFTDPRDPADTPIAHHLYTDVYPNVGGTGGWLSGIDEVTDPGALPRFVGSRFAYRRVARHAWWILLPLALAFVVKLPLLYDLWETTTGGTRKGSVGQTIGLAAVAGGIDLLLLAVVLTVLVKRTWSTATTVERTPGPGGAMGSHGHNDRSRARARVLIGQGYCGYISGHTHAAELGHIGRGFYANAGCGTDVTEECPARLGLPPVFLPLRRLSWLELEAGADLHVRLYHSQIDRDGATWTERLAADHDRNRDPRPQVVGAWPLGDDWPELESPARRLRRTRRIASVAIALAGVVNLASALTPPLVGRISALRDVVPLAVSQTANALVVLAGIGLLALARAVRRGQRLAWKVTIALLVGSFLLHVVKGIDVEEGIWAALIAVYLLVNQRAFNARLERGRFAAVLPMSAAVLAGSVTMSTIVIETVGRSHHLSWWQAVQASAERLVGADTIDLPGRTGHWLAPGLAAVGFGVLVSVLWAITRPAVMRRRAAASDMERARDIVTRHGHGTLDFFALRDDKQFFFTGDSVVAYGVFNGVCLVSPDPIGPSGEEERIWSAFRHFVDRQGWTLAVLGAGEHWLPTYRGSGMHDLYVGDEGVADATRLTLEGNKRKELRQAVNRVAKHGYTITFHDPAKVSVELESQFRDLMGKSRRGDVERGFSMTLGRIFDKRDKGLLLAVCHGPDGVPVAFCQYVPAPGVDGFSLDLMRRDQGDHPNGLFDFVIVKTLEHLRETGGRGLGLNFATMRAVLAGETGQGVATRVQRWVLEQMSDSMQIESLWKFNAKFDPLWQARYVVYDGSEDLLTSAIAIAKAESFWELPIIGRFLQPGELDDPAEASPAR